MYDRIGCCCTLLACPSALLIVRDERKGTFIQLSILMGKIYYIDILVSQRLFYILNCVRLTILGDVRAQFCP
jgi:hypothetical protein